MNFVCHRSISRDRGLLGVNLKLTKRQSCYHIETSQLICSANQFSGFSKMATLTFSEFTLKTV